MNYKEKWEELKERTDKAELSLLELFNKESNTEERNRLQFKLQGVRLIQGYINEMNE
jgi:hypothetical protein